jgi:predicted DNA-binding transcriptional regulator YafY
MSQFERLHRINNLIQDRRVVSFNDLMHDLEVSRATLKRDIAFLRDRFNAPLVFDRDAGGYRYDKPNGGPKFELPGLWFTSEEILALMTMHQMLESLDSGGLLGPHVKPLMTRLSATLDSADGSAQEILKRVKLITVQKRRVDAKYFELIGAALVKRRRLVVDYYGRTRDRRTKREVSPLRLVNYRGNWYLDAWCHKSDGIRMFALDSIHAADMLETAAREVSLKSVDDELGRGYGIYRGEDLQWATLVFNAGAAKWVRAEVWHAAQKARDLGDGRYELRVPFTDPAELEMDILRHGQNVEVLAPASLRTAIARRLSEAVDLYAS